MKEQEFPLSAMHVGYWWESQKERYLLEDLDVDG
jgi:hypothetical protein